MTQLLPKRPLFDPLLAENRSAEYFFARMIGKVRLTRVITVKERSLRRFRVMERQGTQFELNDLGLVIFAIVAGWLLIFQSGLF